MHRFCLNIGWLYTHLVAANSGVPVPMADEVAWPEVVEDGDTERAITAQDGNPAEGPDETTALLPRAAAAEINASIKVFMAMYVPTL